MATPIISLLSFSTAYNSFEQDNNNSSSTVEQRNPPHLRIRANSVSIHDNNSPINSYSSSPPLSMSPSSFTSFLFPPFLTGPITNNVNNNNNNNNNIVNERERETPVGFNHQRRASESSAGAEGTSTVHPTHLPSRRYTIASPRFISPSSLTDSNRDEKKPNSPGSTAYRIPAARFWEIGAREDSSVQVAMENVQFGL